MESLIIVAFIFCVLAWKRIQILKNTRITSRSLCYMPIAQFIFCTLFALIALSFDGNLPKDEINQFVEKYEIIGDLSSALLGLDLTSDQVTMYIMTRNLHSKATYILIGSIVMMFVQIIYAYRKKMNYLIIEGISLIHTLCCFYVYYLYWEAFTFMLNQAGSIKVLNAITESNQSLFSEENISLFAPLVALAAFHYSYHYVLERYYSEN